MAKYNHGGGCGCGLYSECLCNVPSSYSFPLTASSSPDTNVEAVRKMLLERSVTGLKKYGVTTSSRTDIDLQGWLLHLQEELLDAAIYIERLKGDVNKLQSLLGPIVQSK
jgi:hypothetical protein